MRILQILCIVCSLAWLPGTLGARQDHHASADRRAAQVMGFDQQRTSHHFLLLEDGGAIEVSVKDAGDTKNREAIRSHLAHLAAMFGRGVFEAAMRVHAAAVVPGSKVMAARKDTIRYDYADTPGGGRITMVTSDRAALAAVHAFLKYQIAESESVSMS